MRRNLYLAFTMAHPQETKLRYTLAEYLELEAQSEFRHDFYQGEIFAMAGTTKLHNAITLNTAFALKAALKGRGCQVFSENVKLELLRDEYVIYPDVMTECHLHDRGDALITRNPELVAEVLSPSTEAHDRGKKLQHCLALSSLKYYLLISQKEARVEVYRRTERGGVFEVYDQPDQVIELPLMEISLSMADIYEQIDFSEIGD